MGEWTWMNDNNKHKHHNSTCNSVDFSMMITLIEVMEFGITSHVSYIQVITK